MVNRCVVEDALEREKEEIEDRLNVGDLYNIKDRSERTHTIEVSRRILSAINAYTEENKINPREFLSEILSDSIEKALGISVKKNSDYERKDTVIIEAKAKHYASMLGMRGGKKGGPARALALSQKRRSEIAKMAAEKRWGIRR